MNELEEKINLYKIISEQILSMITNNKYKDINSKLDERQDIINGINEIDKDSFIEKYNELGMLEIDNEIKGILNEQLAIVKKELYEYRLTKQVNTMYSNSNREKINIFNKKV
ncbi:MULTISPECIES: flagellar protein FliT [unclassified Clostridioides]|uniref:flagellar protein FliT n=1 Tax=unclassified Clostridioides TaxID=2635829 RepID=UPI001D12812F|nr:flagellar protein FliT [Clostridioides sp. ES-S-0049-03]MCC0657955.1 flagellar protein FliT [Clostridioides sp. ES-S-0123-01]MCC0677212.1 flagellar protein FliT [Clostridioides sp. ES-W-0018-02]MCC0712077.1 flagellar protein FliT [Clostridioides sp. ES-W-0017-02]